jgi:hypothetical protein
VAASAQRDWSQRAGGVDLGFALEAANRAVAERGARCVVLFACSSFLLPMMNLALFHSHWYFKDTFYLVF